MFTRRISISALIFLGEVLAAQVPAPPDGPRFEVVSIRPVPPNAPMMNREQDFTAVLPGGQYIDSRTPVSWMISFAYNVKNPSAQLLGLPKWAQEQPFSVSAKPSQGFPLLPPAENREQVRLMLRAMLADRFHLKVHPETRQERVLDLEVAKGGIKIKEVDPPVPPAKEGLVGAAMGRWRADDWKKVDYSRSGPRISALPETSGGGPDWTERLLRFRREMEGPGNGGWPESWLGIRSRGRRAAGFGIARPVWIALEDRYRSSGVLGRGPRRDANRELTGQFPDRRSAWSTMMTSTGPFVDSSCSPSW